ncbi:hypothetical protein Btru_032722 [Bulinus truncatus]|nr:hypothetical protein Btru_032722 [Bulinus truncatus]
MSLSMRNCPKSHSGYLGKDELKNAEFPDRFKKGIHLIRRLLWSAWILTVRLSVSPLSNESVQETYSKSHFGSGIVVGVQMDSDKHSDCSRCSGENRLGYIDIKTARHVIRNEEDVKNTTCSFFYDTLDSEGKSLMGFNIIKSSVEKDTCIFRCYICDEEFLKHLCDTLKQFHSSRDDLKDKYGNVREDDMIAIVMSHPHGGYKKWSMGPCKHEFRDGDRYLSHQASTCPGSSGAAVLVIGGQKTVVHSKSDGCIGLSSQLTSSESEGEEDGVGVVSC